MDELTANQFIASLVKSVQALCNGYIDFSSSIEVVGHIHLNIDHKVKLDYVLAEEVNKSVSEDATLFSSRSYHSRPPASLTLSHKNSAERLESSPCSQNNSRRRKSHHVPRIDDSESFSFTTIAQDTSHTQANENILAGVLAEKRTDISYSDDTGTAHKSTTVPNANKDSRQTVAASGPSTSSRGRRCETSSGIVTSGVKRKRSSEMDSKSDHPDSLVVFIKEEPEDFSLYPSSTEGATAEDTAAPDFSSIVMESLDHSGQKEVTSFVTGDQGQHLHLQHQPYPIMLHATPETSMTPVSVSMPGPSTNNPPIGPTSTVGPDGPGFSQTAYKQGSLEGQFSTLKANDIHGCPFKTYSDSDMQVALDLVCQGHSIRQSARCAGVPWTTVRDRWSKYKLQAFH